MGEKRRGKRFTADLIHLQIHFPKACNSLSWVRLTPGAWNSDWVSIRMIRPQIPVTSSAGYLLSGSQTTNRP